ncbi:MAG: hypothetical protein ABJB86_16335 [Bacteroidota bacterium]
MILVKLYALGNKTTVSGYVFEDLNHNGSRDNNEPGVHGVAASDQVNIVTTNNQGFYEKKMRAVILQLVYKF